MSWTVGSCVGFMGKRCPESGWWQHTPMRVGWRWRKRGVKNQRKEREPGVAPALLAQVELAGKVVTGDALYAQRKLSR